MKLPEIIESDRIVLKGLTTPSFKLAKILFDTLQKNRSRFQEWLDWTYKIHSVEDEFFYLIECQDKWNKELSFVYNIYDKENNKLLGNISLFSISWENKSAEIGYWLDKEAEGFGYCREALYLLENEIFKFDINRIVIRNDTRNAHSVNVAKKCGYTLDGIMRQNRWCICCQEFRNTNMWSKLKSEWKKDIK